MAIHLTRRSLSMMPFALALADTAKAAEADLLGGAQREGQLVWYTTLVVGQVVRPLIAQFEKKYPGVKVNYVPAPWQETTVRIMNEGRAGQPRGDIFDGGSTVHPLNVAGFIQPYVVQSAAAFPASFRGPAGLWTANIIQPITAAVNTDQVSAADIPKTYEDLLNPRWKGRMAWPDSPDVSGPPGFIGNILQTMGHDRGMDYLQKLAQQKIAIVPSNQRVVLDQAIAGQYPLVLQTYNYHAAISMAEGAPVEWLKLPPTLVSFGCMGLIKNAPHPNAAKLFLEFSMSAEGQQVYSDAGYIPANPVVPTKAKGLRPEDGGYPANVISSFQYSDNEPEWLGLYHRMFT
jgi:ABC-type Fe3+ transport system substrate-binding protein